MSDTKRTQETDRLSEGGRLGVETETTEKKFDHGENDQDGVDSGQETNSTEEKSSRRLSFFQFWEQKESEKEIVFEPLIKNPYDLSYTCLLIPRFPSHQLVGDIVLGLNDRMMQICVAFGWRLDYLSIQSDHMQWVVSVPPAISTGRFMSVTRKETSQYIFDDFPRFERTNPSGDFWAPDYLINTGSQPHSRNVIDQFIQETRRHQGLY